MVYVCVCEFQQSAHISINGCVIRMLIFLKRERIKIKDEQKTELMFKCHTKTIIWINEEILTGGNEIFDDFGQMIK